MSTPPSRTTAAALALLAISSGLTTLSEYALYVALVELGNVHYVAAGVTAGAFGIGLNFALNKLWVFRGIGGSTRRQMIRHVLVTAVGIALGAGVLFLLVDGLGTPYWIGWAIQNAAVFLAYTYPANRYFVFTVHLRAKPP